jgi:nicotinamidase-related amidase
MAGIPTEITLSYAALTAASMGFEVYAVIDASGGFTELAAEVAIFRMVLANIYTTSW